MRGQILRTAALLLGGLTVGSIDALAQAPAISEAECQSLRQRLGAHARLSDGVRRAVAAQVAASAGQPAASPPAAAVPAGRAEAIRARVDQLAKERQTLEDQRLGAMVKFELSRAAQIQGQIQALDTERANLESELATLAKPAPSAAAAPPSDVDRVRCPDMSASLDNAMKIRRRELGAREDQASVIPLLELKGQSADQIAQELAAQFAKGAAATTQIGLLDTDGDGRLEGFVDAPAADVFRLVRQRADGSVSVDVFAVPGGRGTAAYGEMTRRLDEATARRTGQTMADLLATRPAGPPRAMTETAEFGPAFGQFEAGNFADAGRITVAAARSAEFPNFRGETVRVVEIIAPAGGGVALRRVVVLPRPNEQELWEETTTVVRPASYWRSDVEVTRSLETRNKAGAVVGARSPGTTVKFPLER